MTASAPVARPRARWILPEPPDPAVVRSLGDELLLPEPICRLLASRGHVPAELAKRYLRPASGAKQVGDQPEIGTCDVGKQERRPAGRDHASVNFRNLQPRLDASLHSDEVVGAAEVIEKRSEVGKRH